MQSKPRRVNMLALASMMLLLGGMSTVEGKPWWAAAFVVLACFLTVAHFIRVRRFKRFDDMQTFD